MAMFDLQRYPKKRYLIKYEIDIHVYSLEFTENFQIEVSLRK